MHNFVALPTSHDVPDSAVSLEHTRAIKEWTRQLLKLGEGAVVTVAEFSCSDPGCPLLETTIAVFEPGHPNRSWKFTRPKVAVTKLMLLQTFATNPRSER